MGQIKTNAIVLSRADYRENDRMLTLFSPTLGRVDALARRAKSQKSPLLAASELFCSGEYVLYATRDRASVESCHITDTFFPLRESYERFSHGIYLLELCRHVVQPGEENERLFLFLLRSLAHLAYGTSEPKSVTAIFIMGLLSLTGYRPRVTRCISCGEPIGTVPGGYAISTAEAGILCANCKRAEPSIEERDAEAMQRIMRLGLKTLDEGLEISDSAFHALLAMARERLDGTFQSEKALI